MTLKITAYLKLIRPVNMLLIMYVQLTLKYVVFPGINVVTALTDLQFGLLVLTTLFIAAAGNVVNDIYDVGIDRINKPDKLLVGITISEKAAFNYYILLNVLGVGIGFYLANAIGKPGLAGVFIIISALLYTYATSIKNLLLLGNLLISVLVAMSLLIVVLFDIYPAIDTPFRTKQIQVSKLILLYAGFAFFINLIREIVKDLEDMDGDKNGGRATLVIALGRKRTTSIVFVLGVIALVGIIIYANYHLHHFSTTLLGYVVFGVGGSLLYFCIQAWRAETKKHFSRLSLVLKIVMVMGIASLLFISEMNLTT